MKTWKVPAVGDIIIKGHSTDCTKKHITQVTAETLEDNGTTATLRGSLVDIKTGNEHREFVGRAYATYTKEATTQYVFADYADSERANNTRSMTYVAQRYLNNDGADENGLVYNTYLKPLENAELKYTVEHYLPDGNGGYTMVEEEKWGKINETVNAINIAKYKPTEYGAYSTAIMNAEGQEAVLSSPLYVNGKTVLKCYYEQGKNTLLNGASADDLALLQSAHNDKGTNGGRLFEDATKTSITQQVMDVTDPTTGETTSKTVSVVSTVDNDV